MSNLQMLSTEGAERMAIVNNTHVSRWAYHTHSTDFTGSIWYISPIMPTLASVYSLGPLNNGRAAWWTVGNNVGTFTPDLSHISFAPNLDNDPSDTFQDIGLLASVTNSSIHYHRQLLQGRTARVKWYFFQAPNGAWYIVNASWYGALTVMKFAANSNNEYAWQPVNVSGLTANLTPAANGYGMTISFQRTSTPLLTGSAVLPDRVTTSPVRIEVLQPNANAAINPNIRTWIIVHGRLNNSGTAEIQTLATAVKTKRPGDQVLLLDWDDAARSTGGWGAFSAGEQWIEAVGRWAGGALLNYGFAPGNINLIGHSWGSYVADEVAEEIGGSGVNLLVALDPAANTVGSQYNPNDAGTINFAAHSLYSIAIHTNKVFGNEDTPGSADEAFTVAFSSGSQAAGTPTQRHGWSRDLFTALLQGNGGVSALFTLDRLLLRSLGPWQLNRYQADDAYGTIIQRTLQYEGVISSGVAPVRPLAVRFFDKQTGIQNTTLESTTSTNSGAISSTLRNVGGGVASASGVRQVVYATPTQSIAGTNPAVFSSLPIGSYLVEGYSTGTFFGEEFWSSKTFVNVTGGQTTPLTLTRTYPYASSVVTKNDFTGAVIAAGQSVPLGTPVRTEVTVRNDVAGIALNSSVRLILDRNQASAYDFDSNAPIQTIVGSGGTRTYSFVYTPTVASQLYFALEVTTTLPSGSPVRTDSWTWTQTVVVSPSATIQLMANGGFESGTTGWTSSGNSFITTVLSGARSGLRYASLGADISGAGLDNASATLYQTVTIPTTLASATLRFWCSVTTQEASGGFAYDFLRVSVYSTSGALLSTVAVLSNQNVGGYAQVTADLSAFRGQTVRVSFAATSDYSLPTVFRVDDVTLGNP